MPDQTQTGGDKPAENKDPKEAKGGNDELKFDDPQPRRSAASFIIARKNKQIEKLKAKKSDDNEGNDGDEGYEEDDDSDDKDVNKAISQAVDPLKNVIKQQSDAQELRELMGDNEQFPFAKKLESGIKKYMSHPAYENVSIEDIYHMLTSKFGLNKAKDQKDDLDDEANRNRTGGHPRRTPEEKDLPDFKKMSTAEFKEWEEKHNR